MERTLNSSTLLVQVTNGKTGFLACETRFWLSDSSPLLVQVTNGKTGFLAYETRFWFPSEESKSFSPFYYSYEVHSSNPLPDRPHLHSPTKHSRSACAGLLPHNVPCPARCSQQASLCLDIRSLG